MSRLCFSMGAGKTDSRVHCRVGFPSARTRLPGGHGAVVGAGSCLCSAVHGGGQRVQKRAHPRAGLGADPTAASPWTGGEVAARPVPPAAGGISGGSPSRTGGSGAAVPHLRGPAESPGRRCSAPTAHPAAWPGLAQPRVPPRPGRAVRRPRRPAPHRAPSSARRVPPPPAFKAQFVWAGPITGWPCGAANGSRGRGDPANGSATCSRPANGDPVF